MYLIHAPAFVYLPVGQKFGLLRGKQMLAHARQPRSAANQHRSKRVYLVSFRRKMINFSPSTEHFRRVNGETFVIIAWKIITKDNARVGGRQLISADSFSPQMTPCMVSVEIASVVVTPVRTHNSSLTHILMRYRHRLFIQLYIQIIRRHRH